MKKSILLFSIFYVLFSVNAQQVQWASKVIKFSSDLGGKQNGIKRILGKPDAFPQAGSSANAWSPKNALDGKETVEVSFDKPQTVKQIAVFENLNSGCVVKISVDNGSGNYETVWNRKKDWNMPKYKMTLATDRSYYFNRKRRKIQEAPEAVNPGIANAILDNAVANVMAIKVEFNFGLVSGQKQIDAIGISDSETPIEAKVNTNSFFENLPNPEILPLSNFNSSAPAISQDGKILYFTNTVDGKEEIYSCVKTGETWSFPILESTLNENDSYNYVEFVGNNFLLRGGSVFNKGTGESGFCIVKNNEGKYENKGQLKIAAFSNYNETADATMTADAKIIILGIETDFTQGGADLYFANIKEDGTYGLLQNMGKTINSAADEGMPQLLSDNKTLLFSSTGFSSYGNYDIYVSYRLDDTWKKWSEPINLGNKINTDSFEGSPFYDETTEMLYFVRTIEGKSSINRVKIPKNVMKN
jgi:hypothetical protein